MKQDFTLEDILEEQRLARERESSPPSVEYVPDDMGEAYAVEEAQYAPPESGPAEAPAPKEYPAEMAPSENEAFEEDIIDGGFHTPEEEYVPDGYGQEEYDQPQEQKQKKKKKKRKGLFSWRYVLRYSA